MQDHEQGRPSEPLWDRVARESADWITSQNTRGTASWVDEPSGPHISPASCLNETSTSTSARTTTNGSGEEEYASVGVVEALEASKPPSELEEKKADERPLEEVERWLAEHDRGEHSPPAVDKLARPPELDALQLACVALFELTSAARVALHMRLDEMQFSCRFVARRLGISHGHAARLIASLVGLKVIPLVGTSPTRHGQDAYLYRPCAAVKGEAPARLGSLRDRPADASQTVVALVRDAGEEAARHMSEPGAAASPILPDPGEGRAA